MAIKSPTTRRLDCVQLRQPHESAQGPCKYMCIVAIVCTEAIGTLCLCSPLPQVDPKREFHELDQHQNLAVEYFPLVRMHTTTLVAIVPTAMLRHEQVQVITGLGCKFGFVNTFAYSNIVKSSEFQTLVDIEEVTDESAVTETE